jgi:hypothetical protein
MGSKNLTFESELKKDPAKASRGQIIVRAAAVHNSNVEIIMRVAAKNLTGASSCCGTSHAPILEINRPMKAGSQINYV